MVGFNQSLKSEKYDDKWMKPIARIKKLLEFDNIDFWLDQVILSTRNLTKAGKMHQTMGYL
jgi:hypothetical protein